MPTDLTGTPTSLGIGTFNVDADAPSGLGFNEAMAQIDALLAARVTTPAGIVSGEAMVWNGSAWVRSSATPITASGIGSGIVKSPYRKNSSLQVSNSVAETDLLGGAITVAANALSSTGVLRLSAWGSLLNNSGVAQAAPRWKLKLGATTLLDTNTIASALATSANSASWQLSATIINLGVANSQDCTLDWRAVTGIGTAGAVFFTTGSGAYVAPTGTGGLSTIHATGRNPTAVDTTVAQALAFTVTLGAANVNYIASLTGAVVEIL